MSLTLGAHAQRGLQYSTTILALQATRRVMNDTNSFSATSAQKRNKCFCYKYRVRERETSTIADHIAWPNPSISGVRMCVKAQPPSLFWGTDRYVGVQCTACYTAESLEDIPTTVSPRNTQQPPKGERPVKHKETITAPTSTKQPKIDDF